MLCRAIEQPRNSAVITDSSPTNPGWSNERHRQLIRQEGPKSPYRNGQTAVPMIVSSSRLVVAIRNIAEQSGFASTAQFSRLTAHGLIPMIQKIMRATCALAIDEERFDKVKSNLVVTNVRNLERTL